MMRESEIRDKWTRTIPEASPLFGQQLREALAVIAQSESQSIQTKKKVISKRRTLTFVLAAILIMMAVAAAATLLRRNVFEVTMGDTPQNAETMIRRDLAREVIGSAEITVTEAAYDGMSLYIVYSIRDLTAAEQLGEWDERMGMRYLREEDYEQIAALGVGWWSDNLWIDGKLVDMPTMSGGESLPGDENGEFLSFMQYRLDQSGLYLNGENVEIAMPIGERQELVITHDPFHIEKPSKGLVTFYLDCSDRGKVRIENPNVLTEGERWNAKISEVVYSPIQMYVTLDWAVNPEMLAEYIAENGDGFYMDGHKLWDYGGLDVCGVEISDLTLVDETGQPVFEQIQGFYGCGGTGNDQAWFTFPYLEEYPKHMYLAPRSEEGYDMTQAILLK